MFVARFLSLTKNCSLPHSMAAFLQSLPMAIKILSANCQGLGSTEKRLNVLNYLTERKCDIYCLQDTHTTKASERLFRSQWNNETLFSSGTSYPRGVAILFRKNLSSIIHSYISDPQGNYLICDFTIENDRFTLVNYMVPTKTLLTSFII